MVLTHLLRRLPHLAGWIRCRLVAHWILKEHFDEIEMVGRDFDHSLLAAGRKTKTGNLTNSAVFVVVVVVVVVVVLLEGASVLTNPCICDPADYTWSKGRLSRKDRRSSF